MVVWIALGLKHIPLNVVGYTNAKAIQDIQAQAIQDIQAQAIQDIPAQATQEVQVVVAEISLVYLQNSFVKTFLEIK